MDTQNITLAIPKDVLRKIKLIAVKQGTSVPGLMTRMMEEIIARDEGYQAAHRRHIAFLENSPNLGTNGVLGWNREDNFGR